MAAEREKVNVKTSAPANEKESEKIIGRANKNGEKSNLEDIFKKAERVDMQINAKLEEIAYWREFASKAEVVFGAARGGASKKNRSRVEDCVLKIDSIEKSLKSDMDELIGLKEKATLIINMIDVPEYRSLLIHRYLYGKTWYEVADSMGYSYVHIVHRLHPRALKILGEMGKGADD